MELSTASGRLGTRFSSGLWQHGTVKACRRDPLTAIRFGEIMLKAGFRPGVVNILTDLGEPTGVAITYHVGVDKLASTGSTEVGRKIM